jgi:transcriptional regulator with XRE-family HTH domain
MDEQSEDPTGLPHTLADLRREAGLTKAEVGRRMSVHPSRVGQIEAHYPRVRFHSLVSYMNAIGHTIRFIGAGSSIAADQVGPDPRVAGYRVHQSHASEKGRERLITASQQASAPAEELILQGQAAQPGGDHTGREVDQPDPDSDQGDEGEGQQS